MEINHNLNDKKNKNNANIILITIIIVLLVIGGYFTYKYYSQKSSNDISNTNTKTTRPATIRDIADLVNLLRYPQAETLSNGKKISDTQIDDFSMETGDKIVVVYNYYINLLSEYNWSLGPCKMNSDEMSGFISIEESDFKADIILERNDSKKITKINIDIKTGNYTSSNDHNYKLIEEKVSPTPSISPTEISKIKQEGKNDITSDYVIADSNSRVIEKKEIENLSPWELKVARNEIYARHGKEFVYEDMKCYFDGKSWYSKNQNFSETDLSSTEIKNISIILEYEKEIDSQVMSKDLGC